jgi:hypothetical protein
MAQATVATTTSRTPAKPAVPKNPMEKAHAALIAALQEEGPTFVICSFWPEPQDIIDRAGHVEHVLEAVAAYVEAVVADTAQNCRGIDPKIAGLIHDAAGDIGRSIMNAADQMEA